MTPRLSKAGNDDTLVVMQTFVSHDGPLAYAEAGSSADPLVVLLHSGYTDHTTWARQIAPLAERFHVVAPDLRGHGRSAHAGHPFRQADDVAALVRHLDAGPAVLVGVSMGAFAAVETALEHPGTVKALVLTGGGVAEPPPGHDPTEPPPVPAFPSDWPLSLLHRRDPETVRVLRGALARTLAKHTPDEPNLLVPVPDAAARVGELSKVPVLALDGEHEDPAHLACTAAVTGAVERGEDIRIPGAMHLPNMENPEDYNRARLAFLDSL
jgi:pimeloyl-ACP methyl ester carboxylesterase